MKVAVVAPVEESIPPRTYGGLEGVVHLVDRGMTDRGHDVTLLASGGSASSGRLVALTDAPLTAGGRVGRDAMVTRKEVAARRASEVLADLDVDVVLNHSWRVLDHLRSAVCPVLTTVHFPLDREPYRSVFGSWRDARYVSVSWSQQHAHVSLRFAGNVYNGVDLETLPFSARPQGYLAFLGRVSHDKGLDLAIRAARRVGMPLRVAAKLDHDERPWFDSVIAPLLNDGDVELIGEVNTAERADLLGGANALLHPSRWSEPFGLASVEAMACGTPVIALRHGAAGEVIHNGTTGVVVDGEDEGELAAAVLQAIDLPRAPCRAHVERSFTYEKMAMEYEQLALANTNRW